MLESKQLTYAITTLLMGGSLLTDTTGYALADNLGFGEAYIGVNGGVARMKTHDVNQLDLSPIFQNDNDGGSAGYLSGHAHSPVAGIFGGYDYSSGPLVFGLEADLTLPGGASLNNSKGLAYPNSLDNNFATTASTQIPWMASLRPKVGVIIPSGGVVYLTAGPALARVETEHTLVGTIDGFQQAYRKQTRSGYTVGGGITLPISNALAAEAKYLHSNFGTTSYSIPAPADSPYGDAPYKEHSKLSTDMWLLGMRYKFGSDSQKRWQFDEASNFSLETGIKMGVGNGIHGAPQPLLNQPSARIRHVMASRLIWDDLDSYYGETFFRLDHTSHWFAALAFQSGRVRAGSLYDEDFPLPERGYSKTKADLSGIRNGASLMAGYNFIENVGSRIGVFLGFERRNLSLKTSGICQLADNNPCAPKDSSTEDLLSRESHMNFWKVGLDSRLLLTPTTWLDVNAAYVPAVELSGQDNHLARQFIVRDKGHGNGTSMEISLNHSMTPAWSAGVGTRYFSFRSKDGRGNFHDLAPTPNSTTIQTGYSDEQTDVFFQTTYKFGAPSSAFSKQGADNAETYDWSGIYVGGLLGAARLKDEWQDRFGNTLTPRGNNVNYAGFGDHVRSAGAIGGGRLGYDKSFGHWVAGVSFSALHAEASGQDTCFSGLRGLNCQRKAYAIYTLAGRLGWASGDTLFYALGGAARVDGKLGINGRTFQLYRGENQEWKEESQTGWLTGVGVERRIDAHISGYAEYNHIGGLSTSHETFDESTTLKGKPLSTKSELDMVMMGVNYRF